MVNRHKVHVIQFLIHCYQCDGTTRNPVTIRKIIIMELFWSMWNDESNQVLKDKLSQIIKQAAFN